MWKSMKWSAWFLYSILSIMQKNLKYVHGLGQYVNTGWIVLETD